MATTRCQTLAHHIYSIYHHHPPPAVVAVPAVPLVSAQTGQARAFSSTPTATSPPPPTPYATSPLSPTAVSNRVRHVTADDEHQHQLTTPNDPQTPPNATNDPQTPRHHRRRPLRATSPPLTTTGRHVTADDSRRQVTPAASPLEGCRRRKPMGGSEEERGGQDMERGGRGMGSEEAGETGNGEGRGRRFMPPPSLFFYSSFRTGAALAAPVSFRFEWGQRVLPPFLFFSNRGSTCCPPFLSFLNGGSTCCPCFFSFCFERGQHTLPPFFSISNGGGVKPTRRRRFFRLPPRLLGGYLFPAASTNGAA